MSRTTILLICLPSFVQAQKTSLLPDHHLDAIVGEASGELALDTIIGLGRYHRVPATAGFHEGAGYILSKAKEYGLEDAQIESFPADGKTTYFNFRSYLSWGVSSAVLAEISPLAHVIGDYSKNPIVLADYSGSADVTAELIDVGGGTTVNDYAGKNVLGKIVLAGGQTEQVQRIAVERGAVGILSYFPNQDAVWMGEYPNLVRWGHLSYYNAANKFAFMISQGQAREFRARLALGEQIQLHAQVSTRRMPGAYDVVTAVIPGTEPDAGEIVFSCHLDHQKPSSNDNASGCATILEDGRILMKLIREGKLPRPRRTLRFVFPPEMVGTTCFLARHPELVPRIRAAIHMDMVGGDPRITHSVLHITRTPASIPSFVNDVAEVFGEYVIDGSMRMILNADTSDSMLSLQGSKDALWADFTSFSMGSDHQVYESTFHIPAIYLRDSPDIFIHTDGDRPANIDPTKLRRVAVIGAASGYFLAVAGGAAARPLAAEVFARGGKRQSEALRRALAELDAHEAANLVTEAARQEQETLASIAEFTPEQRPLIDNLMEQVKLREAEAGKVLALYGKQAAPVEGTYNRLKPRRNPSIAGLLEVVPGGFAKLDPDPFARIRDGEIIEYDAFNLADGHRSIAQIRNILTAAYGPVTEEALFQYFKELQLLKVVSIE
jgi:aminopeptidase YwaD